MMITLAEHHNLKGLAKQEANTSIKAVSCVAYIARKTISQLHLPLLVREITFLYLQIVLGRH